MALSVDDLENQQKFRHILTLSYNDLLQFIFDYLKKPSVFIFCYWAITLIFMIISTAARISIESDFPMKDILFHSLLGLVIFPVICIPLHELLHIIPYVITGAKRIRVGMDMKQFLFYVTAHRYVASPVQFIIVAILPFLLISLSLLYLVNTSPGLWKWSLSAFLFVHSTMCAGDFALLNFYYLNRDKKIYTWDDADKKEAHYYAVTAE